MRSPGPEHGKTPRGRGHDVRLAQDGESGISVAREFAPDAILLDIGLPGMDGLQVARRIRQDPRLRKVLLIALTGYGQDADRQATRDAGLDHHLAKPADFKTIESTLATVERTSADPAAPFDSHAFGRTTACD